MRSKSCLYAILAVIIIAVIVGITFIKGIQQGDQDKELETTQEITQQIYDFPHIVGYVKSGKDLMKNQEVKYDVIYTSDIDQDTVEKLKERNPGTIILYQSPLNYMFDSAIPVIEATTGMKVTDGFWLKNREGNRCGYGWTPEMWAIDMGNSNNIEIITSFFSNVLEYQPQYEGLFFDVTEERSRCDSVTNTEWSEQTAELFKALREKISNRIIIANSGYNYNATTPFLKYLNGYALESFLSGATEYDDGLETVSLVLEKTREPHFLIYTVYSKNSVTKQNTDPKSIRLAFTLSLLHDFTYLHYDVSMENVGSILWLKEFSTEIGSPLGPYYKKDNAYWREFERGIVISSPDSDITVNFDKNMTDVTTDIESKSFKIETGDGRVYTKS